ncbi:pepsin-like aspartic protease [Tahibacter sp. UC22_41]|uniref:pepsin-like aspartic protease n=1 Tax=Tahibacter sp. UC22_41 TaxID=3350178 RepID=UPI0036DA6EC4
MPRNLLQLPTTLAYARGGYSVALDLGSQECRVNVLLDTGSSTLAVAAQGYAPERDTALTATAYAQQISYGGGRLAGPVLRSRIGLGDRDQHRGLDDVAFACVQGTPPTFFRDADGICGLAFRRLDAAHDLSAPLAAQGRDPAVTWPWPFADSDAAALHDLFEQQPRVELEPLFTALQSHNVFADCFALQIGRAVVHITDAAATTRQLEGDPLNRGVLVLGGGEECQSLYDGAFADLRVLHDVYYNVNLLSLQVGDDAAIPAPALAAEYQAGAVSNAIIDTGSSFLMLEATLYDAVIAAFRARDPRLAELVARFEQAFADGQGLPNSAIDPADWPTLHLRLEAPDGSETCLRCEPDDYWPRNGFYAGQRVFLLLRQIAGWANQSVLGLPLLCGRYCVFDRRDGGTGRIRLAKARAD